LEHVFKNHFPTNQPHRLSDQLPQISETGRHKVRFVYDQHEFEIEHHPYQPKIVKSLKIVEAPVLDYSFKYEDRSKLVGLFKEKGSADDILITQNGHITDSSYSNVAFWDGLEWFTPTTYLLNGVRRQYLISTGAIIERPIMIEDIKNYEKVCLINAMLELGEVEIATNNIH
jgi:4-amino-4-deoxychorismate lyase